MYEAWFHHQYLSHVLVIYEGTRLAAYTAINTETSLKYHLSTRLKVTSQYSLLIKNDSIGYSCKQLMTTPAVLYIRHFSKRVRAKMEFTDCDA